MSIATHQIDLKFNQDWSKVINLYNKISKKWDNHELTTSFHSATEDWVKENDGGVELFRVGNAGYFLPMDELTKNSSVGGSISGPILELLLPWTKQLRKDMEEIDLSSIMFLECNQDMIPHVDGKPLGVSHHCRINYMINDCDSVTCVDNNGTIESYPTVAGTAWLLDVSKLHWVNNNQTRHTFQLTFHRPFDEILNWFNSRPNLSYGQ
jgi:hypothetical protein